MKLLMKAQGVWEAIETESNVDADEKKEEKAMTIISQALSDVMLMQPDASTWRKYRRENVIKRLLRAISDKFIHVATTIEYFGDINNATFEEVVSDNFIHVATTIEYFGYINNATFEEVVGSLKAFEERTLHRHHSNWDEKHLLLTKTQWEAWLGREGNSSKPKRDKSHIKCFNCSDYGHYASECPKPKRDRGDQVNLMCSQEDEEII
ncbi:hypothetical protein GUJ93_ZPchr0010g11193 [Zizania palustris]|uniref:CCHC-type domain-containing protein n=1 Tax=Zizania palustris TaxID=103762 RepID=A0A8J6BB97_ZIZPA|nr:hypothetical protein GUJ93_ZPchr0010g11193 [Zizania palustris]